jgi:AcrR family transcriptional regulator
MPISDCEVRDPRIRRTRQLLQGALKSLMQTKSLDEISVQDITDAATVNRATFYDHYTDKFALLEAMIAGGFHRLLHDREVRFDGACPSAASVLILAVCDYLTQAHEGGTDCTRQNAFEPLMEAAIVAAVRRVLLEGLSRRGSISAITPELVASTASWAIYGAVKQWFYTPGHVPAEEIVPSVLQLILPILQAQTQTQAQTAEQPELHA